ncbi:MAG: hypothetical protein KKA67_14015 [Spirochaetes bacterium]|nr:hypothetical protein [Spirochaetota bacterium]MBU1080503.1 hypothetical protein [Spirochaetota bacterium]
MGKTSFVRGVVSASLAAAIALASCVSSPAPAALDESQARVSASDGSPAPSAASTGAPPSSAVASPDAAIDALVSKARASIDANHLSEGIKFYISALAKATAAGKRSRVDEINGTLSAIGARLTLEPHESWLGPDGSQKSASSRSAARGEGLMPAVYLYESYGYAKSAVPDAFIRFEFISNEGALNASVTTDAKGMANTSISAIAAPGKEATVRAYPIFTSEGYSYAFKTVFRDFSFVAPPNLALVAALERTPSGESANPRVLDAVASALKPLGVEVAAFNGVLASERFKAAFGGDAAALSALSGSVKAGFFALVHVDVGAPTRMEYGGKVYNIFIASAKATLRIVRVDGTVVFAQAKDGVRGQGGTEQAAIDDCLVKVREELAAIVSRDSAAIKKAFSE